MALIKITFDGSSVSAKQDADINHHLTGLIPAGIIKGLGGQLNYSVSNNYITFQDGYVQIYGRRLYVETGSKVYISLDSTRYGYVIITINLSQNTAILGIAESPSSYPVLVQENLMSGGNTYQFPIAKYFKTSTSLNVDSSYARTYLETPLSIANSGYERAIDFIEEERTYYQKLDSGYGNTREFRLSDKQHETKDVTIFFGKVSTGHIIMFPGNLISTLSSFSTCYCDNGVNNEVIISYSKENDVVVTCSNTSHYVRYLYAIR